MDKAGGIGGMVLFGGQMSCSKPARQPVGRDEEEEEPIDKVKVHTNTRKNQKAMGRVRMCPTHSIRASFS